MLIYGVPHEKPLLDKRSNGISHVKGCFLFQNLVHLRHTKMFVKVAENNWKTTSAYTQNFY